MSQTGPDDFDRHVRRVAPDRWLSARLIADAAARTEVLALYALDDELAKIAPAVSQPMLGEIRLQWWREAMEQAAAGGAADHPVIEALAPALKASRLRPDLLDALISSHAAELEPARLADESALAGWIDERHGSLMALAAGLLDGGADDPAMVAGAARAWGWATRRPEDAPTAETRRRIEGRVAAAMRAAREELRSLPIAAFPAVAHAAFARAYARGDRLSELSKRARLLWAAARGTV